MGNDIFLRQLLGIVAIFGLDPVHGGVQFLQQIRPVLIDREIEIRRADLEYGDQAVRTAVSVQGKISVQLARPYLLHRFGVRAGQFDQLRLNAALLA